MQRPSFGAGPVRPVWPFASGHLERRSARQNSSWPLHRAIAGLGRRPLVGKSRDWPLCSSPCPSLESLAAKIERTRRFLSSISGLVSEPPPPPPQLPQHKAERRLQLAATCYWSLLFLAGKSHLSTLDHEDSPTNWPTSSAIRLNGAKKERKKVKCLCHCARPVKRSAPDKILALIGSGPEIRIS